MTETPVLREDATTKTIIAACLSKLTYAGDTTFKQVPGAIENVRNWLEVLYGRAVEEEEKQTADSFYNIDNNGNWDTKLNRTILMTFFDAIKGSGAYYPFYVGMTGGDRPVLTTASAEASKYREHAHFLRLMASRMDQLASEKEAGQ